MTPDPSPAIPVPFSARRRAAPLRKLPPPPDPGAVAAALALARKATPPPAPKRSAIETKIAAAGQDADQILRTLDTEMALRRAGRSIKGDDQVKALRVISVVLLFTLLIAALGAMSYIQMQFTGHGFRHRAGAIANPAPGPSTPDADPGRQSAPPTR